MLPVNTSIIAVVVNESMEEQLAQLATATDSSIEWLVNQAVNRLLEDGLSIFRSDDERTKKIESVEALSSRLQSAEVAIEVMQSELARLRLNSGTEQTDKEIMPSPIDEYPVPKQIIELDVFMNELPPSFNNIDFNIKKVGRFLMANPLLARDFQEAIALYPGKKGDNPAISNFLAGRGHKNSNGEKLKGSRISSLRRAMRLFHEALDTPY